jgi:energy-coupling factor transport system ATP-binding protein
MPSLRINDLTVRYAGSPEPALSDISLVVEGGQAVGITGNTGAGKSTLALAASGLLPRVVRASVSGSVLVDELEATHATAAELIGRVGIVFSAPALQLSASKPTVREELAFGLENLAVPRTEMDARVDAALDRLRVGHLAERDPLTLSGGEQQRVAIASIVVMGTDVLVLDEPAAQLDPQGTDEIAAMISELTADGHAVLVAEHSEEILRAADTRLVLGGGRLVTADSAADADPTLSPQLTAPSIRGGDPVSLEIHNLVHRYPGGIEAVRGVSLSIAPGEAVAIVGQNGSGKTTLVKHLNGLLRPHSGSAFVGGVDIAATPVSDLASTVGFVFQDPDDQLFNSRVDKEVGFGPRNLRLDARQVDLLVEGALTMTGLSEVRSTNPYDLDGSTRKLVALAGVMAMEPPVLVLDEPTMGQDTPGTARIGAIVDSWSAAGRTVIAITHDMEFAARHFGRVVVMRRGEVIFDAPPSEAFAGGNLALLESTGLRPPASRRERRRPLPDVPG